MIYYNTNKSFLIHFFDLWVCQSRIPCIFSGSAWIPWLSMTCPNRGSLLVKKLHLDGKALM